MGIEPVGMGQTGLFYTHLTHCGSEIIRLTTTEGSTTTQMREFKPCTTSVEHQNEKIMSIHQSNAGLLQGDAGGNFLIPLKDWLEKLPQM